MQSLHIFRHLWLAWCETLDLPLRDDGYFWSGSSSFFLAGNYVFVLVHTLVAKLSHTPLSTAACFASAVPQLRRRGFEAEGPECVYAPAPQWGGGPGAAEDIHAADVPGGGAEAGGDGDARGEEGAGWSVGEGDPEGVDARENGVDAGDGGAASSADALVREAGE